MGGGAGRSGRDRPRREIATGAAPVRRGPEAGLTIGVGVTVLVALIPLLRVVSPGWWSLGTVVMVALLLAAGYLARRFGVPSVAATLIEVTVWLLLLTVLFGRGTALFGVIPTPATFRSVPPLIEAAAEQVVSGAAPLDAERAAGVPHHRRRRCCSP